MRLSAKRDKRRPPDPAAYWRRRFFILGGVIAVLGVLAWHFTPAHPAKAPGTSRTARASVAAAQTPDNLPTEAYGSAWPGDSPTASTSAASPTVLASATSSQKATASGAATSGKPQPGASGSAASAGQCAPGGIVLSLFTSQASYGPGKEPQFDVYAVSTAPGACMMAFGPGSVLVIVTRHGQVVWDSAACGSAPASPVQFQTGVPQLLTISWNRAAARPAGCAGSLPAAAWGTFQAVAMSAGQDSAVRTFTLLR
jgi:hypothetical protein